MERKRNPLKDWNYLLMEQTRALIERASMRRELSRGYSEPHTDFTPTILIPGALGHTKELELAQDWFRRRGGIATVDIADPLPKHRVMSQVADMIRLIEGYPEPVQIVGYSLGGIVGYLVACYFAFRGEGEKIKKVVTVDSPVVPVYPNDFNCWAVTFQTNDLLSNPDINTLLGLPTPPGVHLVTLSIENGGIISPKKSRRPGSLSMSLPIEGHRSMYDSPTACRKIKDALSAA